MDPNTFVASAPQRSDSTRSFINKLGKKDYIKNWLRTTRPKSITVNTRPQSTLERPDFTPGEFMQHMCVDFTSLISTAIKSSPSKKQSTRGICKEIMRTNDWYRTHQNAGWQEIVAQDLATNSLFRAVIECEDGKIKRTKSIKWALKFTAGPGVAESTAPETIPEYELSDTTTLVGSSFGNGHRPHKRTEAWCARSKISFNTSPSTNTEYERSVPSEDFADLVGLVELPDSSPAELPGTCRRETKYETDHSTYSISRASTFEAHEEDSLASRPFSISEMTLVSAISPRSYNPQSPLSPLDSFAGLSPLQSAVSSYRDETTSGFAPKYADGAYKKDESQHAHGNHEPHQDHRPKRLSFDVPSVGSRSPRPMTTISAPIVAPSEVGRARRLSFDTSSDELQTEHRTTEISNAKIAPAQDVCSVRAKEIRMPFSTQPLIIPKSPPSSPDRGSNSNSCSLERMSHVRQPKTSESPDKSDPREEIGRWIDDVPCHKDTAPVLPDAPKPHLTRYQLHDTPMSEVDDEEVADNEASSAPNTGASSDNSPSGISTYNGSGKDSSQKSGGGSQISRGNNRGAGRDDEDGTQERKRKRLHSPERDEKRRFACVYHKFDPVTWGPNSDHKYNVCATGKGFRYISEMNRHLTRNHGEYVCSNCYLYFPDNQQREIHNQTCIRPMLNACSQEELWEISWRTRFSDAPMPDSLYKSNQSKAFPPSLNTALALPTITTTTTNPSSSSSSNTTPSTPTPPSTAPSTPISTTLQVHECLVRVDMLEKRVEAFESRIWQHHLKPQNQTHTYTSSPPSQAHVSRTSSSTSSEKCPGLSSSSGPPTFKFTNTNPSTSTSTSTSTSPTTTDDPFFFPTKLTTTTTPDTSSKPSPISDTTFTNWPYCQPTTASQAQAQNPSAARTSFARQVLDDNTLWMVDETGMSASSLNPFLGIGAGMGGDCGDGIGVGLGMEMEMEVEMDMGMGIGSNSLFRGKGVGPSQARGDPPPTDSADFSWGAHA